MSFALLFLAACAHRPGASSAEARNYVYADDRGLTVVSQGASLSHPIGDGALLEVAAVADYVHIAPPAVDTVEPDSEDRLSGHDHDGDGQPDALSSASVPTQAAGEGLHEWRFEGAAGVTASVDVRGAPATAAARVVASTEPDYRSVTGSVSGGVELANRSTALGGYLGAGHDVSLPAEPPPGQAGEWPASQRRVFGGLSVAQILDARTRLSLGGSASLQRGTLESPYRRALVQTTLFPEVLPDARNRLLLNVEAARYLGAGVALHLRPALYADSWGVVAVIPEAAVPVELGPDALLTVRYRWYRQWPASFYADHYHELSEEMSGDPRLGSLDDQVPGVAFRWTVTRSASGDSWLLVSAGYDLSYLRYLDLDVEPVVAHMTAFGLGGAW